MMHKDIKRFGLTGQITSDTFLSTRETLIKEVEDGMRDEGFVPVLDLIPQFTRVYDNTTETFSFELSIYGIHVGEDKAWQVAGMMNGILQERSTRPQR